MKNKNFALIYKTFPNGLAALRDYELLIIESFPAFAGGLRGDV